MLCFQNGEQVKYYVKPFVCSVGGFGDVFFLSEQWLSNFLYNSSWTTNTGRLYGTDLHWQAVWDRLTLAGCMGQIPTDRIWPTWSDWQDPADMIWLTGSDQQDWTGKEQPSSSPRWTKERWPSASSWNCYKTIALWYILFIQGTSNLCKEGEDKNTKAQNAGGRGQEETQPYRKTKGKGFTKD